MNNQRRIKSRQSHPYVLMDQLENLILKKGWPIPFSGYYLVEHERVLTVLDLLRASLTDVLLEAQHEADEKEAAQLIERFKEMQEAPTKGRAAR